MNLLPLTSTSILTGALQSLITNILITHAALLALTVVHRLEDLAHVLDLTHGVGEVAGDDGAPPLVIAPPRLPRCAARGGGACVRRGSSISHIANTKVQRLLTSAQAVNEG
eukprot:TRINITY_DN6013_c0_g1_i3.p2 TRINITY_DN6013_c0_g1~~TRINITY_DN6013_c0_g1_i3.p2  ORF type:complete len:111 (-),score=17.19 TRINITY_DN6013_c0_g1_i3:1041-1373(-)